MAKICPQARVANLSQLGSMMIGFDTPEEAAFGDIPAENRRVIASVTHGDHAYVLLDCGWPTTQYPYGVWCFREDGRWLEGNSSNSGGWCMTDESTGRGILAVWDEAPRNASVVRLRYLGANHEANVTNGFYLLVLPDVELAPLTEWPIVEGFSADGEWTVRPERELEREMELQREMNRLAQGLFERHEFTDNDGGFIEFPNEPS